MHPRSHPVHNFFSHGERRRARAAAVAKRSANAMQQIRARCEIQKRDTAESQISSAFSLCRKFLPRARDDGGLFFAASRR
jgi:hypothetical protein